MMKKIEQVEFDLRESSSSQAFEITLSCDTNSSLANDTMSIDASDFLEADNIRVELNDGNSCFVRYAEELLSIDTTSSMDITINGAVPSHKISIKTKGKVHLIDSEVDYNASINIEASRIQLDVGICNSPSIILNTSGQNESNEVIINRVISATHLVIITNRVVFNANIQTLKLDLDTKLLSQTENSHLIIGLNDRNEINQDKKLKTSSLENEATLMYGQASGYIIAHTIKQDGSIELNYAVMQATKVIQGTNAKLSAKASVLDIIDAQLHGEIGITKGSTLDLKQTHTYSESRISINNSQYKGKTAAHEGRIKINENAIYAVDDTSFKNDASFEIVATGRVLAKKITMSGKAKLNNAGLMAKKINKKTDGKCNVACSFEGIEILSILDKGQLMSTGHMAIGLLNNTNELKFDGGTSSIISYHEHATGQTNINNNTKISIDKSTWEGISVISKNSLLNVENAIISRKANMHIKNKASFVALNLDIFDKGKLRLEKTTSVKVTKLFIDGYGQVNSSSSEFHIKDVLIDGGLNLYDESRVYIENIRVRNTGEFNLEEKTKATVGRLEMAKGSKSDVLHSQLKAGRVQIDSKLKVSHSKFQAIKMDINGSGIFTLEKNSDAQFAELHINKGGRANISNSSLHADKVHVSGSFSAYNKSKIDIKMLNNKGYARFEDSKVLSSYVRIKPGATMQVKNDAHVIAHVLEQDGFIGVSHAAMTVQKLNQGANAHLSIKASRLDVTQAKLRGKTGASHGSNLYFEQSRTYASATVDVDDSQYSGASAVHEGNVNLNDNAEYTVVSTTLKGHADFNVAATAKVLAKKISVSGNAKLDNNGCAIIDKLNIADKGYARLAGKEAIRSLDNANKVDFDGSQSTIAYYNEHAGAETNIHNKAAVSMNGSTWKGVSSIRENSNVDVGKAKISTGAKMVVTKSILAGEKLNNNGSLVTQEAFIRVNHLQQNGQFHTTDTWAKTEHLDNTGHWHYEGWLDVDTKNIQSSLNSRMTGADGSYYNLTAETSNNLGQENHDSIHQNVKQMSGAEAGNLVNATGKHANKIVRKHVSVEAETADPVILDIHNRDQSVELGLKTAGDITNTIHFQTKALSLETTAGSINLQAGATTEKDVTLKAAKNINKAGASVTSEHGNAFVEAKGRVDNSNGGTIAAKKGLALVKGATVDNRSYASANRSTIEGKNTSVRATAGNVENQGSLIGGLDFVSVTATGNVNNTALAEQVTGKYGPVTKFTSGQILGGKNGANVRAENKVYNEGQIASTGYTIISGKHGVVMQAQSSTFIEAERAWKSGKGAQGIMYQVAMRHQPDDTRNLFEQTEGVVWNQPTVSGDLVYVSAQEGGVLLEGVDYHSKHGMLVEARDDISLPSATAITKKVERETEFFGLITSSDTKVTQQNEKINVLSNSEGEMRVHSSQGTVHGNALFLGAKDSELIVKAKGAIELECRKLEHVEDKHSFSMGFSVAGQSLSLRGAATGGNLGESLAAADPVLAAAKEYAGSTNGFESAVNDANLIIEVGKLAEDLAGKGLAGTLAKRTDVSLDFKIEDTRTQYQTEGQGGVHGFGRVTFESETADIKLGVDTSNIGTLKVKTPASFIYHNNELRKSEHNQTIDLGIKTSLERGAKPEANFSVSHSSSNEAPQTQRVASGIGLLELDVGKNVEFSGAKLGAKDITGYIGGNIITRDKINTNQSSSISYGGSTSGNVNFSGSSNDKTSMGAYGGLHIENGINNNSNHFLTVGGKHQNFGRQGITTNDAATNHLYESIKKEQHDLQLHESRAGIGFSVNAKNLTDSKSRNLTFKPDIEDNRSTIKEDGVHEISKARVKTKLSEGNMHKVKGWMKGPRHEGASSNQRNSVPEPIIHTGERSSSQPAPRINQASSSASTSQAAAKPRPHTW